MQSSKKFNPTISDVIVLESRAERARDPLAPYASLVLKIVESYIHCVSCVKPLVVVVFEFGMEKLERNARTDLEELARLEYIAGVIAQSREESEELVGQVKLNIDFFQKRLTHINAIYLAVIGPSTNSCFYNFTFRSGVFNVASDCYNSVLPFDPSDILVEY